MPEAMEARRIGVMGGTFDPIHFGHLFIAEEARKRCELDEVVFVPNREPAHREGKAAHADAALRFEMTQLATESNAHFQVSRIELERTGPSFALDTIRQMQREYSPDGESPNAELFFIAGADSMRDILTWHRADELFAACRFIAFARPGFDLEAAKQALSAEQQNRVTWFPDAPSLHIASRELRQRVRDGQTLRYLVPDVVRRFITARSLYR